MEGGGAERVISNITPSLSEKYQVYLLLLKNSRFYDIPKNITVISFSKIKHDILMIPLFPFYIWKLKKLTKEHNPYRAISFLEIANFVNILSNKRAIISFRTSLHFFDSGSVNKVYKFLIKKLYPKAKKIIVNSKENKIELSEKLNIPQDKITTIYNPINTASMNEVKNKSVDLPFKQTSNHKIFITIGRLDTMKNISVIIKSFKKSSPGNILLIIGNGQEKANLENLIEKYNLKQQVFLLGCQKNVHTYLNTADYFIFASRVEGFPNVLIEAMACNLPIITSDFKTGARELIDSNLNFQDKIKYPHYGPNGALLSLNNFQKDFKKIDFKKLRQDQHKITKFNLKETIKAWSKVINS